MVLNYIISEFSKTLKAFLIMNSFISIHSFENLLILLKLVHATKYHSSSLSLSCTTQNFISRYLILSISPFNLYISDLTFRRLFCYNPFPGKTFQTRFGKCIKIFILQYRLTRFTSSFQRRKEVKKLVRIRSVPL